MTVTVTAGADDDLVNESSSITHTVTGYWRVAAAGLTVTVADDDTANVTLSDTTVTVGETSTSSYTIVLAFEPSQRRHGNDR